MLSKHFSSQNQAYSFKKKKPTKALHSLQIANCYQHTYVVEEMASDNFPFLSCGMLRNQSEAATSVQKKL